MFRPGGTVTAGNSSGINDGAAAMIIASERLAVRLGLTIRARVVGVASAGVAPRVMGIGPVPATRKLLAQLNIDVGEVDIIELNEAFAAQASRYSATSACWRMGNISIRTEALSPSGILLG